MERVIMISHTNILVTGRTCYTVQCQYLGTSLLWSSELVSQAAGRMFQLASNNNQCPI